MNTISIRNRSSYNFIRVAGAVFLFAAVAVYSTLGVLAQSDEEKAKQVGPPGSIKFVGKNLVATANGVFHKWKFTKIDLNREDMTKSVFEIEVDVSSLDTGIVKRDNHLRTADFFDVKNYPKATLKFSNAKLHGKSKTGNAVYRAQLDMGLHGTQQRLEIDFEVVREKPFEVKGKIILNRLDFNIGEPYKKLNPMSIKEDIPLTFSAVLPGTD